VNRKFERIQGGVCQYDRILRSVVAAIIIAGPLEVVDHEVWFQMQAEGIWGADEKLDADEGAEITKGKLKWFRQKVVWGSIEASILLLVFYRLT
jgi:hypothetical protein